MSKKATERVVGMENCRFCGDTGKWAFIVPKSSLELEYGASGYTK
jgi:hypothetical protein